MSTLKTNNAQIGQSATAANNFTWRQPAVPDGTVRLSQGNADAPMSDILIASASGLAIGSPSIGAERIVQGTAQSTSSGTEYGYTGIPSWVKRITFINSSVGVTSSSAVIQLGSGSYATSGYSGATFSFNDNGTFYNKLQTASGFIAPSNSVLIFTLLSSSSNTWVVTGTTNVPSTYYSYVTGTITLAGTLDRIRLNAGWTGGNSFTGGSINIIYEG